MTPAVALPVLDNVWARDLDHLDQHRRLARERSCHRCSPKGQSIMSFSPQLPPMSPEQTARYGDATATILRAELAAAEARAQHANIIWRLRASTGYDLLQAAENAVTSLRTALSAYIVWDSDPVQTMITEINGVASGPFGAACAVARRVALEGLVDRMDANAHQPNAPGDPQGNAGPEGAPAPVFILTRDDAAELLVEASFVLRHRMSAGRQADDIAWTAVQLCEHDRGRAWMLRQAREYRRAKIHLSRAPYAHMMGTKFYVRASLFVAAILRACAAGEEQNR